MNCKKVLSRLQAYVDGEAPAKVMRETEEHLETCPACRRELERIRELGDILDSLDVPPLPRGFSTRVMAEARGRAPLVREKTPVFPLGWQPLRWLFDLSVPMRLAACLTVLLACLLGMFMSKELHVSRGQETATEELQAIEGFEWFAPMPPESLGSAYLALASTSSGTEEMR